MPIPNEADAGFADQAEPDSVDFDIITKGYGRTGVLEGCAVSAQGSPDMTVAVAAGMVEVDGNRGAVTAGNVAIGTAHATLARFDLVQADDAGVKAVTAGTAAANPVFPAHPASRAILAAVYVPAADTTIAANQIIDKRIMLSSYDGGSFPLVAGNWYTGQSGMGSVSSTAFTMVANRLYFLPYFSPRRRVYDRIAWLVATAGAGGTTARLGIYTSSDGGEPGVLLLDAGTVAVDSTGSKEITISQELLGYRLYWLAMVSDGVPVGRGLDVAEGGGFFVGRKDTGTVSRTIRQVYGAHTYAALPAVAPALTYDDGNLGAPALMVRAV